MPFEISSSDRKGWFSAALFQKNLTRFWPLWGLYGAFWLFWLPMNIFLDHWVTSEEYHVMALLRSALVATPIMGMGYAVLVAMALFSYLMNNRSAGMIHALPIRREGLFLTNVLSALTFIAGPTLVVTLLSLVAQAGKGVYLPGETFRWFGVNLIVTLMFFAFATCCAMFTGHLLALPVFYGIMNFLVIGVCWLADVACGLLLVGLESFGLSNATWVRWCTPVYQVMHHLRDYSYYMMDRMSGSGGLVYDVPPSSGLTIAVCYSLVLAVAFLMVAGAVYHYRQLERSGDVVTVGWVRPVFQNGVGVCVGLSLGAFLYAAFFRDFGPWAYVICVTVCAVIGAFVAKMLLKKSLKVFREWKTPAVLGLCVLALLSGLRMDILGFQRRIPDLERVSAIHLSGLHSSPEDMGSYLNLEVDVQTDPELAEEIVALHRELVADFPRLERTSRGDWTNEWDGDDRYQVADTKSVHIQYRLKNGNEMTRSYDVPVTADELADPSSYAARMERIVNNPDIMLRNRHGASHGQGKEEIEAVGGTFHRYDRKHDDEGGTDASVTLTYEAANALWQAYWEDVEAGRARRYLLESRERFENCYYDNQITLQLMVTPDPADKDQTDLYHVAITPEKSMTSLMAALEQGKLDQYLAQQSRK